MSAAAPLDAPWKAALRDRIMQNLDDMLQNTTEAYQRKIADNGAAPLDLLYRLQHEYNRDVLHLQTTADAQVASEIARAEADLASRTAGADVWRPAHSPGAGDPTQALVEERLAMLSLRGLHTDSGDSSAGSATYGYSSYPSTEATSLSACSSPEPYADRALSNAEYLDMQSARAADKQSRERQERAKRAQVQQDEFARRAEAILQRKRARRAGPARPDTPEPISAATSTSSATSTTSSTSEPAASSDVVFKAEHPLSAQDVTNLMTYHDQQWTYMLTLPHVQWVDLPWPLLSFSSPRRVEDLALGAVAEYIFAPLTVHHDRDKAKARLKDLSRRWAPERVEARYVVRVKDPDERDMVRDGVASVARILADLLAKWNEL